MTIDTNEVLYRISQALRLTEEDILQTYSLEEYPMETSHLQSLLKKRQDKDFMLCSHEELGVFFVGHIVLKRGAKSEKSPQEQSTEITENLIIKKLRIALQLKEAETEIIFNLADIMLSKQQLSSLFRKETHKNFKRCSNELLMAFLEGLDAFYFTGEEE